MMIPVRSNQPHNDGNPASERYCRTGSTFLSYNRMKLLSFTVIGGGALGNEAVKALGLLGAGSVTIIDPDSIELSNLSRSVFFAPEDCGKPKAEVLAHALSKKFPETHWNFHSSEIADVGLRKLANTNLLLSCVDSDLARIEIALASLRLNLPVSDAGLGGPDYWRGRVSFFAGRRSACFCCKLSPARRRVLLTTAQAAGNSCWAETKLSGLPSTPTMAAVFGSLQVDLGLRWLLEFDGFSNEEYLSPTIEIRLDSHASLQQFVTHRSVDCPFHAAAQQDLFPLPHLGATARELLDCQSAQVVELDWPLCMKAHCIECGHQWQPMRRIAWLRRKGSCPSCNSCKILEDENITRLDRNCSWADVPMTSLGLPPDHLYTVR